ncbi:diguanylate cyclase [Mesorhizobium australicum]|uniref:diguanylate cyclase n=2 Tax=Mesorhizobium australicum TaxID=536018 RepID=A0A1X7NS18_9HYPH|nr:GGDEF domain-containing protein [Mesorhizobium australicum]SMH39976.1 diguanylate cyclase [Mesorhizobium australicum]
MRTAAANSFQPADIATKIAMTMRQMGVIGLPRNYEIFYEICTGSNDALCDDVRALGPMPTQDQLDGIGRKYFAGTNGRNVLEEARDQVATKIEEVMSLLRRERSSLEKYGSILGKTSGGLNSQITQDILLRIVGIMSAATESTLEQGRQIETSIIDKSAELEKVKVTLEEYKKLADTDPLTQIWNRRAFDRAVASIYDTEKGRMFSALIIADIDRFKDFNDRHGHPVGDRILQIVADIISSNVQPGMFVARTGGEEFAIIGEGMSEEGISRVAEAIRTAIEAAPFVSTDTGMSYGPVTISLGICMASEAAGPEDLYIKADRALYASKVSGRNQITRHSSLVDGKARKNWFIYRKD